MTERSTNNSKVVLEMVREVKQTTNQLQDGMTDIKVSLAEIKNEIKNMPVVDKEKHKAIEQRLDFQDEKIDKVQKEIKDLKASGWGLVASILLLFIKSLWELLVIK